MSKKVLFWLGLALVVLGLTAATAEAKVQGSAPTATATPASGWGTDTYNDGALD